MFYKHLLVVVIGQTYIPDLTEYPDQGHVAGTGGGTQLHSACFALREDCAENGRQGLFCAGSYHCAKKPVTTMLTYPWKCTVLHCSHLGNTWKPLVLMTRHFDYHPR